MSTQSGKENTEPDNVNVGLIATVTIVGALLVVAIAAALTALVRSETAVYSTEAGTHANLGHVARLKAEQAAKLVAAPAWSDRATGRVSLPIDRAMQLVAADIQKNPYLATPLPPKPKEEPQAAQAADGGAPAAPEGVAPAGSAAPPGSAVPAPSAPEPAAPAPGASGASPASSGGAP